MADLHVRPKAAAPDLEPHVAGCNVAHEPQLSAHTVCEPVQSHSD